MYEIISIIILTGHATELTRGKKQGIRVVRSDPTLSCRLPGPAEKENYLPVGHRNSAAMFFQ